MSTSSVGIRELRNRLSEYLRRVKAGERIIITERGLPVGQILPLQADPENRLRELAQAGLVEWSGEPVPPYKPMAINRGAGLLSDLVIEARE